MNDTRPEGNDSAAHYEREAASPAEIIRIKRARAVAKRSIMGDMAAWCDGKAREIAAQNPGRKRGSISQVGEFGVQIAKGIGDHIWAEREKIAVPERDNTPDPTATLLAKMAEALKAMVDRWEPDCGWTDRRLWKGAREALAEYEAVMKGRTS